MQTHGRSGRPEATSVTALQRSPSGALIRRERLYYSPDHPHSKTRGGDFRAEGNIRSHACQGAMGLREPVVLGPWLRLALRGVDFP